MGREETTVLFDGGFRSNKNPGAGGIVLAQNVPSISRAKYSELNVTSLDIMAEELGWYIGDMIDIIKIDVEGYEIHVIRGGRKLFESKRIRHIFMEGDIQGPGKRKHLREIIRTLTKAGYEAFKIGGYSGPDTPFGHVEAGEVEEELLSQCGGGTGPKRKKCNIWWKLRKTWVLKGVALHG